MPTLENWAASLGSNDEQRQRWSVLLQEAYNDNYYRDQFLQEVSAPRSTTTATTNAVAPGAPVESLNEQTLLDSLTQVREALAVSELRGRTADYLIVDDPGPAAAEYFIKMRDIGRAVEHYRNEFETELLEPVKFTVRESDHTGPGALVVEVKARATGLQAAFVLWLDCEGGVSASRLRAIMEQLCQSMVQKSLFEGVDYSVVEATVQQRAAEQELLYRRQRDNLHARHRWEANTGWGIAASRSI